MINCEINLILAWSEYCVVASKVAKDAGLEADGAVAIANNPTKATFRIADTKLYVAVVTLSTEDDSYSSN